MAVLIKFAVKDLNLPLLFQELEVAGFSGGGLLVAGFTRLSDSHYTPFTATVVPGAIHVFVP